MPPTIQSHYWRRIKTMEEAVAIAEAAREQKPERRPKIKSPVRETPTGPVRKTHRSSRISSAGKPPLPVQCGKPPLPLYFSPCGGSWWSDPLKQRPSMRLRKAAAIQNDQESQGATLQRPMRMVFARLADPSHKLPMPGLARDFGRDWRDTATQDGVERIPGRSW
jgi:hypothetical protein